jgi:hypothetical protein
MISPLYFGGVSSLSTEDFVLINGFSNSYWGWGAEDDDLLSRVGHYNMTVIHEPLNFTRFTMLSHHKASPNPDRLKILEETTKRIEYDGLSNLQYQRIFLRRKLYYTRILVDIRPNAQEISNSISSLALHSNLIPIFSQKLKLINAIAKSNSP